MKAITHETSTKAGWIGATTLILLFGLFNSLAFATTLEDVEERGYLQCSASPGLAGFSAPDNAGNWKGLDSDYCRAIAAAIFGDVEAVRFNPLSGRERLVAVQSGQVDVLVRTTTWTMSRDTQIGLSFAGVNFYDGQGFLVRKDLGVDSVLDLDGASICVLSGTTTELNLADYFAIHSMSYKPILFQDQPEAIAAYGANRCDVFTTDSSGLAALRLSLADSSAHMILPETISKEPLGLAVRKGDDQWFDIVRWVHNALLNAEELGVTSENVDEMRSSKNPTIRNLLGVEGDFGEGIGLDSEWAYNAIKNVGNYGEIFERNLGSDTPLDLPRGLNALWSEGGLQYGIPIR